ncbi:Rib/alpha-like domain-containing protein, partial [Streptococcus parasanguinis]|uniref:Rib/alpha-like domain-containing protein n=1 Tax=Streptococcus parasanguinis TaxID=1318 RepID=UPI0032192F66
KYEVPVTVTVVDPSTDADNNTPTAKAQTVKTGDQPNAKDSIGNVGDLPEGTKFEYKTPVDTTTEGEKDAIVVVTYPDGSKDEVPVKVTVKDPRTDADKNTPVAKDQTVKPGDQPNAKDSIGNVGDLPSGTTFEYKTPVDTTTEGEKDAIVVVTYPDGSKDEVPVKVTVKAPHADTDKNIPTSKDQTVNKVETPDAKNSEKEIQVQKVSVSDKKAESAKLPNTGEEQSTSIALLGAVLGMFGLAGLAKRKKNED